MHLCGGLKWWTRARLWYHLKLVLEPNVVVTRRAGTERQMPWSAESGGLDPKWRVNKYLGLDYATNGKYVHGSAPNTKVKGFSLEMLMHTTDV